jgi:calcium-dependent protein kinase
MRIYEIIETTTRIYIISEYLSGGQLFEKLVSCERITERISARYLCHIILALNYCHKLNVIHRDIKPENLLFESDAPDAHLKIIDFGISRISNSHNNDLQVSVGAVNYMAPERFKGQVSTKSDIWSAGVILHTMLSGRLPFQAETDAKTAKMICQEAVNMHNTVWRSISTEAKSLIIRMLQKDPKDRPTAEEILSDPWLVSYTRCTISDNPIDPEALLNLSKFNVTPI